MSEKVLEFKEYGEVRQYGFGVKLFFLYLLNIVDWFCTQTLIDSGYFQELNPIMRAIMQYPIVGFFVKCVLPLALSILIWLFYKIFKLSQNRFTNFIVYSGVIIYSVVIVVHIMNFLMLFVAVEI